MGMFSLLRNRSALTRSAWTRCFGVLLAWMIVAAGMPRWELHAHESVDHGRTHSDALEAHVGLAQLAHEDAGEHHAFDHSAAVDATSDDSGIDEERPFAPHLHEITTVGATLPLFARLGVPPLAPSRWTWSTHFSAAPSAAWPPPLRPPIA